MISRVQCEFTDEIIEKIANTVAAWRGEEVTPRPQAGEGQGVRVVASAANENPSVTNQYQDIPGYCRSVTLAEITEHGHVLTPGRYVGAEAVEDDDEVFADKMQKLTETLGEQMAKGAELDQLIRQKLGGLGYEF
jgi:type I restriction enzyme M protein